MLSARPLLVAAWIIAAAIPSAGAVDALPGGRGINVMTLHMQRVTTLENALHKAVNDRDSAALDKLLSPFFEIRRTAGVSVQRGAWLREGVKSDGQLHGLSAYEVQGAVIANFTLVTPGRHNRFIVDTWIREQDEWRLRVRFETTEAQ
jgi:hypothetical protein